MTILDELMNYFGINALPETATFMDFLPWFCKLVLAVFLIAWQLEISIAGKLQNVYNFKRRKLVVSGERKRIVEDKAR